MNFLYCDFETTMTREINLKRLTLRQYLASSSIMGMSFAVNDDQVQYLGVEDFDTTFLEWLESVCLDPDFTWVSHLSAFDVRVARRKLGMPQPQHVHCSLELACAAFPNQEGGYRLGALAKTLRLGADKIALDLSKYFTRDALAEYCIRDTELCRAVHKLCLAKLDPLEVKISELANQVRELWFVVRNDRVKAAMESFGEAAAASVLKAMEHLDRDGDVITDASLDAFGWLRKPGTLGPDDPGMPKSVKSAKIKHLLLDRLGFDTRTITYKKINPSHLVQNPGAANALLGTSQANKALSHKRRVAVFDTSTEVDAELGYFRAHTGRYSSPSVGKGLNLHNQPKRVKAIAKPIRQMFELPEGLCFVRGDLSNAEYRCEGFLAHCEYIENLFARDIFADPYSEFGFSATGLRVTKEDPARQIFKNCVLGLGFLMGVGTWMSNIALLISDAANEVTLDDLDKVCTAQRWTPVADRWVKACQTKLGCAWQIASVAYHTRNAFHRIHPEFQRLGKWLMYVVTRISSAVDPEYELAECYKLASAPDPTRLLLSIDDSLSGRSLRAQCGPWPAAHVVWRDIGMHETKFGFCLASVQSGDKGYRKLTPNILIENITQHCARNALVKAKLELDKRGWHYLLSVHDEMMIICDQNPKTVLAARRDLLDVMGPNNKLGWDWSVVINPAEVNVSKSLYEMPMEELLPPIGEKMVKGKMKPVYPSPAAWWCRLSEGDASLLDHLP